jgi:hypothetical protein
MDMSSTVRSRWTCHLQWEAVGFDAVIGGKAFLTFLYVSPNESLDEKSYIYINE